MQATSPFTKSFEELPLVLPIFPLPGTVLLPKGHLPLNIFEPRYLNMIADAMSSDRLIGVIQPTDNNLTPDLASVGCAGRIIRYEETADGRLEIMLSGICRFRLNEELNCLRGYRLIKPDWSDFTIDYAPPVMPNKEEVLLFKGAVRQYLEQAELKFEAAILDKLSVEDLVNSLASFLPLATADKQILLESKTLSDRVTAFAAILEAGDSDTVQH